MINTTLNSMGQTQAQTNISSSGLGTTVSQPDGGVTNITGGTRQGLNLFHSFGEFNVPEGKIANFQNEAGAPQTDNILSRVTGSNSSNIFGTLQTTDFGNANLFLMNPKGIIFGPKSALNIGGSFYATTANIIEFTDGMQFSAVPGPDDASLLTSASPEAFGFLGQETPTINLNGTIENTAAVRIEGLDSKGSDIVIVARDAFSEEKNGIVDGVKITGTLLTQGGKFELASVASPGRTVLEPVNLNDFNNQGRLTLVEGSEINTKGNFVGNNGGKVLIQGGEIKLEINSKIITSPREGLPPAPPTFIPNPSLGEGGDIEINGTESVTVAGSFVSTSSVLTSGGGGSITLAAPTVSLIDNSIIQTSAAFFGSSGSVVIKTTDSAPLSIKDSQINTTAFGPAVGDGGNITLNAPQVHIDGSNISSNTGSTTASAGTIEFNVGDITLTNSTQVDSSAALGTSQAGNIRVQGMNASGSSANSVLIDSDSTLSTTSGNISADAVGGSININAKQVALLNGGGLNANGRSGEAGLISVTASEGVTISGTSSTGSSSQISVIRQDGGNSGITSPSVQINTANLSILGGNITLTNEGNGPGGNLLVQGVDGNGAMARSISISGQSTKDNPAGLFTTTSGKGPGGNTTLIANQVIVRNNAEVTSSSTSSNTGAGAAGSVTVRTTNSIFLNGATIATEAVEGNGNEIQLIAGQNVELNNQAEVTAKSIAGNAGDISVEAKDSILITDSFVTTSSGGGDGGNIDFSANNLIFVDPSVISSSVGNGLGGNVSMNADSIVFQASQVLANATSGQGGKITMSANVVLQDLSSKFDASAGPTGIDGEVNIRAPIQNLNGTIAPLPENILSATTLYSQRCVAQKNGQFSSFSRGGGTGPLSGANGLLPSPLGANFSSIDASVSSQTEYHITIDRISRGLQPDLTRVRKKELLSNKSNFNLFEKDCS
ncbi:MAG: hypothetical protein NPIRA04_12730 [Nitrospirales bacterium]|nr:MAG: hypothetical protein NPIRA04_12730 [Nitrospirales bacterium]